MLTQERLKQVVSYNPDNGVFTRILALSNCVKVGDILGGDNGRGYLRTRIDGKLYMNHRLAWLYVYGSMPEFEIDHINHNKKDNRIANLRSCTRSENSRNSPIGIRNKSGIVGVQYRERDRKFYATITNNKKKIHIGVYETAEDALLAYNDAARKYGYHENHGSTVSNFNNRKDSGIQGIMNSGR